ncbi:MAG: ATP-binding cassette domain-containing protein, partial [Nitrospinales bacterium]
TTTMNMLTCIFPATSGTAKICGFDIFEQPLEIKKVIGYLPENPPLYKDMVVKDFLIFSAKLHRVPNNKIAAAAERMLERCGLREVQGRIIERLSKGYQQRVGLAQALIHDPDILILDEPTIGLDPIQIIEIRKFIQELASEHTIILSSHILPEITQICRRVIIINDGEIAAEDSLEGLNASMRRTERLTLKVRHGNDEIARKISAMDPVISVRAEGDDRFQIECRLDSNFQDTVARLALENHWGIVELKPVSMSLEEIFLKLTTEEHGVNA